MPEFIILFVSIISVSFSYFLLGFELKRKYLVQYSKEKQTNTMTNSMKYGRNQHSSINEIEVSSTIIINDENTSLMVPGQKVKIVHECEHCEAQYSQKGNEVFILFGQFKVEKILKGSLDSIPSPSPSVKIQN